MPSVNPYIILVAVLIAILFLSGLDSKYWGK